eukprot:scaffold11622_cov63-Phaeocystis_antarctica.AAC.5
MPSVCLARPAAKQSLRPAWTNPRRSPARGRGPGAMSAPWVRAPQPFRSAFALPLRQKLSRSFASA